MKPFQVWGKAAAAFYNVEVQSFSAGTEATAVHPNTIVALKHAGFSIDKDQQTTNPIYSIQCSPHSSALKCFSKIIAHPTNPTSGFLAIMTCGDANEACPFVRGSIARIPLSYSDPKVYDGTEREEESYENTSHEVAREMLYLFHLITNQNSQ
jgi:arsenate reductase (thioredoxin)